MKGEWDRGWEVKGGGEGRGKGEEKGGGGEWRREGGEGKGEERMRQEEEDEQRRGYQAQHHTCTDNSATYPWDIAHTNIHIHPPFQSVPLLIVVGWCSLSSSPSPPNNIGQEQLTTGRHIFE